MSDTEYHVGKLRKITCEGETLEEKCKTIALANNEPLGKFQTSYIEVVKYELFDKYYVNGDDVYEFFDHIKKDDWEDISELNVNGDGTHSFIMKFYNGGTCLSEKLDDAFDKIKK